jgi:erythromycin esterase
MYPWQFRSIQHEAPYAGIPGKGKRIHHFSIESNMPEAYALNEYIIDGKDDARKLMAGMYFWTWNTQEVLGMIE